MLGVNQKTPIDGVVREHLACASQFLEALRAGAFQPQSRDRFEDLSRRCEANLDALRIAGDKAIALGRAAMGDDSETAAVIALLLAECESGQPAASEQGVQLLRHETPEIRQAAWWGLRLASSRHVEPHLLALAERDKWEFAPAAALDILAFHRLPVPVGLGPLLDSDSDEIAWLLAEAGGRIQDASNRTHLKQFITRGSSRVREAALRASARCGLPELAGFCRAVASETEPMAPEVVEFLGVVGSREDLPQLLRLTSDPVLANAAMGALGRLGFPACMPVLLDLLSDPRLAEPAANAVERITGQAVPRGAPPKPSPSLSEDELDLWEPTPPPDVPAAYDWWKANEAKFDLNKRWQAGVCVSDDPLGPVFELLPLAIRHDVYLRQRALVRDTPDWELETWSWRQKSPCW